MSKPLVRWTNRGGLRHQWGVRPGGLAVPPIFGADEDVCRPREINSGFDNKGRAKREKVVYHRETNPFSMTAPFDLQPVSQLGFC